MRAEGSWPRAGMLLALALALGVVAERSVARREAAVTAQLGPLARVVVLARDVEAGKELGARDLGYVSLPARYVAPRSLTSARQVQGLRLLAGLPRGTPLVSGVLTSTSQEATTALASGDRVLELVAGGSTRLVHAGGLVDVVAARTDSDGNATSRVVASGVRVLDARSADSADGDPRVSVTVRVPRAQALELTAALGEEATLRLLPRASWDAGG